jgi:hypothetical protein
MSGILLMSVGNSYASVPGAPTIGTATATVANTATVSFTAPVSDGGFTITSYTATSSPGGITGTLVQAGSGTITVTGLVGGTTYTFTVTATNVIGTSAPSAASNSIVAFAPPTVIGQVFGGGYYAGQIGVSSVATHYLVVGPKASAQSSLKWKNASTDTPGAASAIDGPQNTVDIVADGNSTVYPAGHFCNDLVIGGYSDWYMPAKNEVEVCFYNLKPTTGNNVTTSGINPNAVPARASNYTTGTPARTSAAAFQSGNSEAFDSEAYWTSTEAAAADAWGQQFGVPGYVGNQFQLYKSATVRVRAVRRVAV